MECGYGRRDLSRSVARGLTAVQLPLGLSESVRSCGMTEQMSRGEQELKALLSDAKCNGSLDGGA